MAEPLDFDKLSIEITSSTSQILFVIIALFAIIYNGYILYNMNNELTSLWEKYEREDIGTDKKLQNKDFSKWLFEKRLAPPVSIITPT